MITSLIVVENLVSKKLGAFIYFVIQSWALDRHPFLILLKLCLKSLYLPSSNWQSSTSFDKRRRSVHFLSTVLLIRFLRSKESETFLRQKFISYLLISLDLSFTVIISQILLTLQEAFFPVMKVGPAAAANCYEGEQEKKEEAAVRWNLPED